ncbi:hypothetical protein [Pseudorhodoferax sp. Leaf274]|uniref:hypothetical protein n=1 Tax=Pseudorhodoferax sp. Leaf274 TaxID=1736318 RepID=UPI0007031863|nr:hypothetical protein [Pseudorhodoferax sp. Leaf274]KQP37568.1 hypothetical protein ASF44_14595 [Pseudorhodoferax sp. Leaf274]
MLMRADSEGHDTDAVLDDVLSRWHHWMKDKPINGVDRLDDPAFREVATRSGWDSADDILDRELEVRLMRAVDFHVSGDERGQGGLPEPYRAAVYCIARNCYTGRKVWLSPRLPRDPMERGAVLLEARRLLTRRLVVAGVL